MIVLKKENKGFTLIELLAVIFIISLLFGVSFYYVNNVINDSREKSKVLSEASIKKSASLYVQEYTDEVVWTEKNGDIKGTCVNVSKLKEKGYIKEKQMKDISSNGSVILSKKNGTIFADEYVEERNCEGNSVIPIPTSKDYCSNPTYNGSDLNLVDLKDIPMEVKDKVKLENNSERNAGSYAVKVVLENGYVWSDGTKTYKTITCTIKKAMPKLSFSQSGQTSGTVGSSATVDIYSKNDNGKDVVGRLKVKSSNSNYVIGSIVNKNLVVNILASRADVTTFLYVTLTPDDIKNYYIATAIYTVGTAGLQPVEVPKCKDKLFYNEKKQVLLDSINRKAYSLSGIIEAAEVGDYKFSASLKYGYFWSNPDKNNKESEFSVVTRTCRLKNELITPTLNIKSVTNKDKDDNIFKGNLTSGTLMKSKKITITLKSNVRGTIKANSLDTSKVSIVSTRTALDGVTHYVEVQAIGEVSKVKDLVSITFSAIKNYDVYFNVFPTKKYKLKIIPNEYRNNYWYYAHETFKNNSFLYTNASVIWDKDMLISFYFIIPKGGTDNNGYMLIGTYNNNRNAGADKQLVLKVKKNKKLEIQIGNNSWTTNQTVPFGTKLYATFNWSSSAQTFTLTVKDGNKKEYVNKTGKVSGMSGWSNGIRFGNTRGDGIPYGNIEIGSIRLAYWCEYGKKISPIPGKDSSKITRPTWSFSHWNSSTDGSGTVLTDETKMPLEELNWYAIWKRFYYIDYNLNLEYHSSFNDENTYLGNDAPKIAEVNEVIHIDHATTTVTGYLFDGWSGSNLSANAQKGTKTKLQEWGDKTKSSWFKNLADLNSTVTLTANWRPKKLTVKYDCRYKKDGKYVIGGTQTFAYGSSNSDRRINSGCTPPNGKSTGIWYENTSFDGNSFAFTDVVGSRWINSKVPAGMGDATITLYAKWVNSSYKISYELNGGTAGSKSPEAAEYDSIILISHPTKVGYTFNGWTLEGNHTSKAMHGKERDSVTEKWTDPSNTRIWDAFFKNLSTKSETVTLIANWRPNTYFIDYYDSGDVSKPTSATYDELTNIKRPVKKGYTFSGWDLDGDDTSTAKYAFSNIGTLYNWKKKNKGTFFKNLTPTRDAVVTLTGNWTLNNYTVNFDSSLYGCPVSGSKTVAYNKVLHFENPSCEGYIFGGWVMFGGDTSVAKYGTTKKPNTTWSDGNTGTYFKNLTGGTNTVTLMAQWIPRSITVEYDCGSGTVGNTQTFTYGYGDANPSVFTGCSRSCAGNTCYKEKDHLYYPKLNKTYARGYIRSDPFIINRLKGEANDGSIITLKVGWDSFTVDNDKEKKIIVKYHSNGAVAASGYEINDNKFLKNKSTGKYEFEYNYKSNNEIKLPNAKNVFNPGSLDINSGRAWCLNSNPDNCLSDGVNITADELASFAGCNFEKSDTCEIILCANWTDNNSLTLGYYRLGDTVSIVVYSPKIHENTNYHISAVHIGLSDTTFNTMIESGKYDINSIDALFKPFDSGFNKCDFDSNSYYHCDSRLNSAYISDSNKVGYNGAGGGIGFFMGSFSANKLFKGGGSSSTAAVCVRLGDYHINNSDLQNSFYDNVYCFNIYNANIPVKYYYLVYGDHWKR